MQYSLFLMKRSVEFGLNNKFLIESLPYNYKFQPLNFPLFNKLGLCTCFSSFWNFQTKDGRRQLIITIRFVLVVS